jgi:hypothetical protein
VAGRVPERCCLALCDDARSNTNQLKICFVNYAYLCVLKFEERNKQITIENIFSIESVFAATCFGPSSLGWLLEHIKRSINIALLEMRSHVSIYIHSCCLYLI